MELHVHFSITDDVKVSGRVELKECSAAERAAEMQYLLMDSLGYLRKTRDVNAGMRLIYQIKQVLHGDESFIV